MDLWEIKLWGIRKNFQIGQILKTTTFWFLNVDLLFFKYMILQLRVI